MKRFITLLSIILLVGFFNPKFLWDAYNYDPSGDPPQIVHYFSE
jgi:hypothetical protein